MGLSVEQKKDYLEEAQGRESVYIRQIDGLYDKALIGVTNDALSFFNSRRYLNAKDDNARARAAKQDTGIKSISGKIAKLGADTLKIINTAQVTSYNKEGVILTALWNDNTPDLVTFQFEKAGKAKTKELLTEYYLGFQYPSWQKSATDTAVDSWTRNSRGVMSSNIRKVGKVAPSVQLTSDLIKTITTMERKAKSLMDGSLSETQRILTNDVRQAVLKAEQELAKALQKRALKWL